MKSGKPELKPHHQFLETIIEATLMAGEAIIEIYQNEDLQIEFKSDRSPLTRADKKANDIILEYLLPTGIPVISEESKQLAFEYRRVWNRCWMVDPLDGTKEFIKGNGEFTVNIALIENGRPVLGVIFAPALKTLYFASVSDGKAYKIMVSGSGNSIPELISNADEIKPSVIKEKIKVVGSRSHMNQETLDYIDTLKFKYGKRVEIVSKGSSLKFCLVAEGTANIYPRFTPSMEWDTAAGQAICEAVGLTVCVADTGKAITYNRENLLNGSFIVLDGR